MYYRTNYDESMPFKKIIASRATRSNNLPPLYPAFRGRLPIARAKLNDLLKLCEDLPIPPSYHWFYSGIANDENIDEDTLSESEDIEESDMDD